MPTFTNKEKMPVGKFKHSYSTCLVYFIHRVVQLELITLSEKDFFPEY